MSKTVLITGGSRGIGLGIAQTLAAEGWNVAINGTRPAQDIAPVMEMLRKWGGKVIYCQGSIGEAAGRAAMLEKVKAEFGHLNLLVNNAGIAPPERKDLLEATEESFDLLMAINLKGPYFLSQAAANWMIREKEKDSLFEGMIINITSISATVASVNRGEYCVAKAGLSMATQLFASRLGEFNIPVYELRPGIIKTDMTAGVTEKYDRLIGSGLTVQKRWGFPEDVGKAVASFARGDFPYSTGQVMMVDGGLTISRL